MRIALVIFSFLLGCAPSVTQLPPFLDPSNPNAPESRIAAPKNMDMPSSQRADKQSVAPKVHEHQHMKHEPQTMKMDPNMDMGGE